MARGQNDQQTQAFNASQNAANTAAGEAANAYGTASAGENAILANPVSQAEQEGITTAGTQALNTSFDAARAKAAERVGASGNTAGDTALEDSLARTQGAQAGDLGRTNAMDLSTLAMQRKQQALDALSKLYGTAQGSATSLYGSSPASLPHGSYNFGIPGVVSVGGGN